MDKGEGQLRDTRVVEWRTRLTVRVRNSKALTLSSGIFAASNALCDQNLLADHNFQSMIEVERRVEERMGGAQSRAGLASYARAMRNKSVRTHVHCFGQTQRAQRYVFHAYALTIKNPQRVGCENQSGVAAAR